MQDGPFYARLAELGTLKAGRLGKRPSNRVLADATGMSPATIGAWLRGECFPADVGKLVAAVRAIASEAEASGVAAPDGLLDPGRWRALYRAEASRRARSLARAAEDRGRFRHAARLRKRAADAGDAMAAAELINQLRGIFPSVRDLPWPFAEHVDLDDPGSVANLMDELRRVGAAQQLAVLLGREPGSRAACDDLDGAVILLRELRRYEATEQAAVLAGRLAESVRLDDPAQVIKLIGGLRGVGAHAQLAVLLDRDPASGVVLDDPDAVVALVLELRMVGADDQALILSKRGEARYAGHDPESASRASGALRVNLDDNDEAFEFRFLYGSCEPDVAAVMLTALASAGEEEKVRRLLASDPARTVPLGDATDVARLLEAFRTLNADEQIRVLLARNPAAHVAPGDVAGAARMLDALRGVGAERLSPRQARDLAGQVAAEDAWGMALVLKMLAEDGAVGEIAELLARRPAVHADLGDPQAAAGLLAVLRALGEHEQVQTLVDRLPAEGHCALFLDQGDNRTRYRFGRDPDGSPAAPWTWEDLD